MKRKEQTGHSYHSSAYHEGTKPNSWHGNPSTTNSGRSYGGVRPWNQNQNYSGQGTHDFYNRRPSRANKPHYQRLPAQGMDANNASHHNRHHAQNHQKSVAFNPHNKSGGWLEDNNFEYPQKPMYTSGSANDGWSMESAKHVMDIHNEKPEQDSRRLFQGNHGSWFQQQPKSLGENEIAQYDAICHNNTEQEAIYNNHSYNSLCADDRNSGCPDYLHHSKTYRYNEHTNARGFSNNGIKPLKNLQEPFHLNKSTMEEDEEEDDDEDDFSSDSEEERAVDKAHRKLFSKVKEVVDKICGTTKPSLIGNVEMSCLVCFPVQYFKGWKALLAHAQTFRKRKIIQHRGYHRALDSILKVKEVEGQGQEQETPADVCVTLIDTSLSESHIIVWPPVVVIEKIDLGSHLSQSKVNSKEPQIAQGQVTVEDTTVQTLLSQELQNLHPKDIISCGSSQSIILFEASSLGYMEAKAMNDRLRERQRGRQNFLHFKDYMHSSHQRKYHETKILLFGYLPEPADLKIIDPNKTIVKDWSEESYREKVQGAIKRMKQDHEYKQAKLKAMELEVVTLSEEEDKNKIHKQLISCQIKKRDEEIEKQQNLICQMREYFAKEDRELFETFEEKMREIDKDGSSKVNMLKKDLERGEKLYEEERISRMKQIQSRHLALQELKQGYEKLAEEKALDREAEIMIKRKNFMEEVRKAEVTINVKIQMVESSLQTEQQEELKKLAEESEREREAFYSEWMKENQTMKKEVEELRKNKEQVQESDKMKESEQLQPPECAVCWDHLTPENRALLVPCGHTQVCIECAQAVFTTKKECPICRQHIARKPMKCPKSLFGA